MLGISPSKAMRATAWIRSSTVLGAGSRRFAVLGDGVYALLSGHMPWLRQLILLR